MLNNIVVHGRLVRDPEKRVTQSGVSVCSFTIACERDTKDKAVDFLDCTAFRQTADFIAQHFAKGNAILVNGRLQIREWTDKENNKRRNAEIAVDRAWFCESKRKADDDERPPMPTDADAPPVEDLAQKRADLAELAQFPNVQFADIDGDDLPF